MRLAILILTAGALALSACAAPQGSSLQPADAATAMISGGPVSMRVQTSGGGAGQDPLSVLTLARADGRSMQFTEANHTPYDVMAQAANGPLASVMGLVNGETPVLYHARQGGSGQPFVCGPEGAPSLGVYTAEDGDVTIVGLKSGFEFETRADGTYEALPYSPDHVCARLRFRRG